MSYVVKGDPSAQLVAKFPSYTSETKTYIETREYRGTESAIRGLELQMQTAGYSYRITHDGPVWSMQIDIPQQDVDESIDRWEIFTESTEKSFFELPSVIAEAQTWDLNLDPGERNYKAVVLEAVDTPNDLTGNLAWPKANSVIEHLKSGVTGWQLDLVVLRRTRRVQNELAPIYRIALDSGLVLYTGGQLGVPASVGFELPTAPPIGSVTIYQWGWRRRSQRVENVGNWVEQTIELVFAPWSLLAYTPSNTPLAW